MLRTHVIADVLTALVALGLISRLMVAGSKRKRGSMAGQRPFTDARAAASRQ
jgi:hypothetical protein